MQVKIETSKGYVLAVKVPDDAKDIKYFDDENDPYLSFFIRDSSGLLTDRLYTKVNNGFQLIAPLSEITEEQAKIMVSNTGGPWNAYKDYQHDNNWFSSALWSFKSLMQAHKVYEVNPYSENGKPKFFDDDDEMFENTIKWQHAESQTGNWIILFKEK